MPVAVLGISHQTAPVEVRERFAYGRHEIPAALAAVVDAAAVDEAVLLSTCNRTEFYLSLPDERRALESLRALLAERSGQSPEALGRYLYFQKDRAAVQHLLRVTAGLESMVVGEAQIQGQVKEAYATAREVVSQRGPVVGAGLNRLFQTALSVGGRVRSETALGEGAASVASASVELAKKIFGELKGRRALVLGAGDMGQLTLECLRAEGVQSSMVATRTFAHACELAQRWGSRAVPMEELEQALAQVDIVVSSTAAPHPVLTRERVRRAFPNGAKRPLCIIDIAIPRDVEPSVGDEPQLFLYNIDDLQQIVAANLDRRRSELPHAEAIVAGGVEEYWGWYATLAVVPTIQDLRGRGEALRQGELDRLFRRLGHLSAEDQQLIDQMTRSLTNKLLHAPTVRLRQAAGNGRGTAVLDATRYLFELDHTEAAEEEKKA